MTTKMAILNLERMSATVNQAINVMRKAELKGATWLPIYSEDVASDKGRGWTDTFKCSACECYTTLPNMVRESEMDYEYCPHCGRKMFEDEDE